MIQANLPNISQIRSEAEPDVTSGPGIMLLLDSSQMLPVSGSLVQASAGWRLFYAEDAAGQPEDAYSAFNTLLEALVDTKVYKTQDGLPLTVDEARIIRTSQGMFLKLVMSTTIEKNQISYDPMRDVQLTTGG